jgi:putative SOS response-associated peptidase YedK
LCGRVVWVWDAKTGMLIAKYDDHALDDPEIRHVLEKMRYNVPPASHLPVIQGIDGATRVTIARWGFPIRERPNGVFNTRIDNALESPLWRDVIGQSHCIFPVRGFYEWKRTARVNVPHYIHRQDDEPMLLAGLIGKRTVGDEHKWCASIVTCPPNALVAQLHDRMPVVLEPEAADEWLHPERIGVEGAMKLAAPAGDVLAMHEVTPDVNDTDNDAPHLREPVKRQRWF